MTHEELKAEAKAQGYNLIRINKPERLLPCKCGCKRRSRWWTSNGNITLECLRCGFHVYGRNEADARKNWNKAVYSETV